MTFFVPTAPRPACLYEDEHVLVLDKPSGLLSVPGRGPDKQDCLVNRTLAYWTDALVVHRLDMATSGLIMFARNKQAQRFLGDAFAARQIAKRYVAIVHGKLDTAPDNNYWHTVDAPLICDWERRPLQKVDPAIGKPSQTRYRTASIQDNVPDGYTRVWLEPITGRSHQLRVHMAYLGYPIQGDALYAPPTVAASSPRLQLHASLLQFPHPVDEHLITVESPIPF